MCVRSNAYACSNNNGCYLCVTHRTVRGSVSVRWPVTRHDQNTYMLHDEVGVKQEVVSKQEVVFTEAADARANVIQRENEIERDSVSVSGAR